MVGTLENPTLDLNPALPETLDVITATRSGTATYTDADGVIREAASDTVRVDYVDGVPMILVEPSATNLMLYSEDFSNAGWSKVFNVVVTPSSVDAPDGTTNAFKLSELQLTDGDYGLSELLNTTPSASYTFSAYFKATNDSDVGKKLKMRIRRNAGVFVSSDNNITLTAEWVRHSVTIDLLSDNTSCWFVVTRDTSSPTALQAEECLIWGAQAELGSVATSYIPTSGSPVLRQADDLVISGSDFTDFFSTTENTFYCEFDPRPSDEARFLLGSQASSARFIFQSGSSNNWNIYDGTLSSVFGTESSTGLQRAAATFDGTSKEASLNGGGENTSAHNGNLLNVPTELRLGKAYYGGGYLNGHIKRVIWWPYSSENL
jgi:hypothetical protein